MKDYAIEPIEGKWFVLEVKDWITVWQSKPFETKEEADMEKLRLIELDAHQAREIKYLELELHNSDSEDDEYRKSKETALAWVKRDPEGYFKAGEDEEAKQNGDE